MVSAQRLKLESLDVLSRFENLLSIITCAATPSAAIPARTARQGLTLVHFSDQPEDLLRDDSAGFSDKAPQKIVPRVS